MSITTIHAALKNIASKQYTARDLILAIVAFGIAVPLVFLFATTPSEASANDPLRARSLTLLEQAEPLVGTLTAPGPNASLSEVTDYKMAVLDATDHLATVDEEGREFAVYPVTAEDGEIDLCVMVEDGDGLLSYGEATVCNS